MVNILVSGDFCPYSRVSESIDSSEYSKIFGDDLISLISKSDYSLVNLECTILLDSKAIPIDKCGPNLKQNKKVLEALNYAGFDCVTLANNHFSDFGNQGVTDTMNALRESNFDFVGGGINLTDAQKILYKKIKDKTVAIINICETEFTVASVSDGGSNPIDLISNFYQIKEAKKQADFVLIIIHGGSEHYQLPTPRMQKNYRFFVDSGADAVINHHQHCYSGYEIHNGKPIFYGIGNFSFDSAQKRNGIWNEGCQVSLFFSDDKIDFKLIPYIQGNDSPGIVLMNKEEEINFFKKIEELNSIIASPVLLQEHHQDFMQKTYMDYITIFNPYQNNILRKLLKHNLLPRFISNEFPKYWTKDRALNLISFMQCESHIERCLYALKHHYKTNIKL